MLLHKFKFKIKSNKALLLDPLIDGYKAKPFLFKILVSYILGLAAFIRKYVAPAA